VSDAVESALASYDEAAPGASVATREVVRDLARYAPAFASVAIARPEIVRAALSRSLEHEEGTAELKDRLATYEGVATDGPALHRALRWERHRALFRVVLREVRNLADIDQTGAELSALASACIDAAMTAARNDQEARDGVATDERGERIPLVALGMGKLGGWELNLGSDVDLCFFYGTDAGRTEGGRSVHEHFSKIVRRATRALTEVTEDGFVFRVDLRLRPEGSRGPLVNSQASAERYYADFGRTWERAAMLRARPIAGDLGFGSELMKSLESFVFRRAVDPKVAHALHAMVERARKDLRARDGNLKLGRGGIREVEFFVQALQLVWGGRHPELRVTGTIEAIRRLKSAGLLQEGEAMTLEAAWALLRRIEHRIQMSAGYQTHDLPADREDLARSLQHPSVEAFDRALAETRARVAEIFDTLVVDEPAHPTRYARLLEAVSEGTPPGELAPLVEATLNLRDPDEASSHLARLARRASTPFGPLGREKQPHLGPMLLEELEHAADPDAALRWLTELLLRSGDGMLRLLEAETRLTRRLVGVLGTSRALAQDLVRHPEAFGELVLFGAPPDAEQLARIHEGLPPFDPEDPDVGPRFVSALRRAKRDATLRIGLALGDDRGDDLDGRLLQRRLSLLAEEQLRAALRFASEETFARFGEPEASMAVVGLGKLGGRELGFGSDLDLVFLFDRDGELGGRTHGELFARVAQRMLRILSRIDAEGPGYEVDTRLRPSGSRGMLVVSREGFLRYHETRAQAWERQALVRARVVATVGSSRQEDLDAMLEETAYARGAMPPEELATLRGRIQGELAGEGRRRYHPKLGFGGLVDVELATQWLQMRHAEDRSVRRRHTLDALDALRASGALDEDDADTFVRGYLFFRAAEQSLRLLDDSVDAVLVPGGPRAHAAARTMGLRARDGATEVEVLEDEWRRQAHAVREVFERLVAPIDAGPPWTPPEGSS